MLHTADIKDIISGRIADTYFHRTLHILRQRGINKEVVVEIRAEKLPFNWPWAVFAGVEECLRFLSSLHLDIEVRCLPEGTIFYPGDPTMSIQGRFQDICVHETAILGFLCQASGISTTAARCKKAAGAKTLLSFGSRRMHPALAPFIERNAFIGGADGVSSERGAELIGEEPKGTMPHALVLLIGDTVEATKAFNQYMPSTVDRISLIDTFNDEKFEAIKVAEALKDQLDGVRIDTPHSRRGDLLKLLEEIRWELDIRGYQHIKLFVSGGLDDEQILNLKHIADGFGVGTYISNASTINFSYDIVEIEGKPVAKKGKKSGKKTILRCLNCKKHVHIIGDSAEKENCSCGGKLQPVTKTFIKNGNLIMELPSVQDIRKYVIEQIKEIS